MSTQKLSQVFLLFVLACGACLPSFAQTTDATALPASVVPSRITQRVDDTQLVILPGNRPPMARPAFDQGLVDPNLSMQKIVLVLKRSPEQEAALAAFDERQLDSTSPDFHHWLHAEEFGRTYGPSDADMATIVGWLEHEGFRVDNVGKGRVNIQFSGTAAQVQNAFHVEMHRYLVAGKNHIANDRDPQIPAALAPVIVGVASLHDFFPHPLSWFGQYVHRDPATGKVTPIEPQPGGVQAPVSLKPSLVTRDGGPVKARPALTYAGEDGNTHEDLAPADFAAVYNITPLYNKNINGAGVTVAISASSDVTLNDVAVYRKTFGLPATTVNVIETDPGTDPGISDPSENTEDLEMVSAAAPGATLDLVVSAGTSTTYGFVLSDEYIIDNETAPIMTVSYGQCELAVGTAGNSSANQLFQQGATEGMTIFLASGDSGSATCEPQESTMPPADVYGDQVSGYASSPYVTAVGGTDFTWSYGTQEPPYTTYWNTGNSTTGGTAKGYIPEIVWNTTCSSPALLNYFVDNDGNPAFTNNEDLCNAAANSNYEGLVTFSGGGGGYSHCTTNDTPANPTSLDSSSCSGGYAKPSWQTGTGVPADGKRDLPDVSMFASFGYGLLQSPYTINSTEILICVSNASKGISCNYTDPSQIPLQENGGTSAAAPFTAGVMALILQKVGGEKQGLINPTLYGLAAKQSTTACNANTVVAGNSCYFFDITSGSNAQVCETGAPNCVTNTSGDPYGIMDGYAAGVGYDRASGLGTLNVTNIVNAWPTGTGASSATLTPSTLSFPSTPVNTTSATTETATLTNTGSGALTLNSLALNGSGANSYGASTTCGGTIAAGASCSFTFTFDPQSAGSQPATFSVVDSAGTQTLSLSGTGASSGTLSVTVSPTSLAFGSVTVGATSAAQTITIRNTGSGPLTLNGNTIGGANAGAFIKSGTTCSSPLAAGASCTNSIEFAPGAAGAMSATLTVNTNATGTAPTVSLSGTGGSGVSVTVTPTSLSFGSLAVGSTSTAQTITIKNTSAAAITLNGNTIAGANASSFIKSSTTCSSPLAAGASCTNSLEFVPASAGALSAVLTVNTSASGTAPTVSLSGTGTSAGGVTVSVSPTNLSFGSLAVGSTSAAQIITIKNNGTTAITLNGNTIGGTNPSSFVKSATTCSSPLAAGASCTNSIEFVPGAAGALSAVLTVNTSASGTAPTVAFSGTGTAGSGSTVTVTPTSYTFPATAVGSVSAAEVITIKNTGSTAITLNGNTFSGSAAFVKTATSCSSPLAAGASCTNTIQFEPTAAGTVTAVLTVNTSASGTPPTVSFSGSTTAGGGLTVSPSALGFATTKVGTTSAAQVITIKNVSSGPISLNGNTFTGSGAASFLRSATTCYSPLPAGASCTNSIAFDPTVTGPISASLSVNSSAPGSPQLIPLNGTGQ
jgi:hypothetical protein